MFCLLKLDGSPRKVMHPEEKNVETKQASEKEESSWSPPVSFTCCVTPRQARV